LYKDFNKCSEILDQIKELGFSYATFSGITWGLTDLQIPKEKQDILKEAQKKLMK